ncbi:MAG: hypothetical protein GY759_08690 [Chloroflexi bacterium]|nr:hypothetical protein [Chloroflexota bacterium]
MDIVKVRKDFPRLQIYGGLDKRALALGRHAIDTELEYKLPPLLRQGGYLDCGETVTLVFGDRSSGSPGWMAQTFCEETFEFKTWVDPLATYEFEALPRSPTVQIVPGEPALAVCIAPSQVMINTPFYYHVSGSRSKQYGIMT